MKKLIMAALLLPAALLTGCTGMSELVKAGADDHAILFGDVNSIYGTGKGMRLNPATNQDVKITRPDGTIIEVKSH